MFHRFFIEIIVVIFIEKILMLLIEIFYFLINSTLTGSSLMKKSIFAAGNDRLEVQRTSMTSSDEYSGLKP